MANNPVYYVDEDGEFVQLITAGIGAAISTGVTLWSMSKEAGGFSNIDWSKGSGSWARVGASAATGALAGSGLGGLAVGIGAAVVGNGADQYIRNDFSFNDFDFVELGASGLGAWAGGALGNAFTNSKWVGSLVKNNLVNTTVYGQHRILSTAIEKGLGGAIGSVGGWQTQLWTTEAIHGLIDVMNNHSLLGGVIKNNGGAVYLEDVHKLPKRNPQNSVTFPITPIYVTPN